MNPSFQPALGAAQAAAGPQHYPAGALYVVATPIGNLADITLRALHLLGLVDAIACEDTRHTASLLQAYGLHRPLLALHQHNEAEAAIGVVERLRRGERIAYVSDAGTPGISDPGARLCAAVQAAGLRAIPLPGASSVTTLLSVAGLAATETDAAFEFTGFLPTKGSARARALRRLAQQPHACVLLEAPHRIQTLAKDLIELGERKVTLGRELTKQFEQLVTLRCDELADWLVADPMHGKGEFALALHPLARAAASEDGPDAEALRVLKLLLAELPLKGAARLAAEITGGSKNALYQAGLALKPDKY
ncbi:16S rRNA (cytidine(1402)-2'-O)-methyltransferase [Malikia sp.]|uniref:16S rRNA (cytidine(1402)-2'-O)-methyltransferase n=1 Tax=Malikia sp. TaxID=2070706 RepID=UPI0026289422|nr:16S rRNA (cytidine(1402)-2'-O)-methyltransferase [Malikia sp.]MDD2727754.1 16S rRNA (cytidine(1402)-2'-O)-methyltransferase [Malikia sp.]